jgi:uncharacterized protein
MAKEMSVVDWIARILVIIGAINWGLVSFWNDLVAVLFGTGIFATIIYALVGLSGLWELIRLFGK